MIEYDVVEHLFVAMIASIYRLLVFPGLTHHTVNYLVLNGTCGSGVGISHDKVTVVGVVVHFLSYVYQYSLYLF